jgi:aspartyl-tRNA(Asn)/glutamyl-tRNA(Gln) amidotransferase subunit C
MSLTLEEVKHIAELARLELTNEEIQRYQQQLSDVLDYAVRLQQVDTSQIAPTASVFSERSPLRVDQPAAGLPVEVLLANAPLAEDNQFRVPPVIE